MFFFFWRDTIQPIITPSGYTHAKPLHHAWLCEGNCCQGNCGCKRRVPRFPEEGLTLRWSGRKRYLSVGLLDLGHSNCDPRGKWLFSIYFSVCCLSCPQALFPWVLAKPTYLDSFSCWHCDAETLSLLVSVRRTHSVDLFSALQN